MFFRDFSKFAFFPKMSYNYSIVKILRKELIYMGEKYTGKSKDLEKANSKGITERAKKYIASALMAGSLMVSGAPAMAYGYTEQELAQHNEYVQEIRNHGKNIRIEHDKVIEGIEKALEDGSITEDQIRKQLMDEIANSLKDSSITQEQRSVVEKFKAKLEQSNSPSKVLKEKIRDSSKTMADDFEESADNTYNEFTKIKDKHLISMQTIEAKEGDTKPRVDLYLNDISSLTQKQIETLQKQYHVDSIILNRYYEADKNNAAELSRQFTYSPETYKKMLQVMDEKFGDLKNNKNLTELQKATIALKRMENIRYDYAALAATDLSDPKMSTSRNLEDPLFNDTAICAGYADLFKNAMSYVGIESKEIRGYVDAVGNPNAEPGQANHVWNQVKLEGKWYNLDITEIQMKRLPWEQVLKPGNPHPYLFTSDQEFNSTRSQQQSSPYTPLMGLAEEAKESISDVDIDSALKVAIEYEKNRGKSKTSFVAKMQDRFSKKEKATASASLENTKSEESKSEVTASKSLKSEREAFLAELSNNGEYRNLGAKAAAAPQNLEQQTPTRDGNLEDMER